MPSIIVLQKLSHTMTHGTFTTKVYKSTARWQTKRRMSHGELKNDSGNL